MPEATVDGEAPWRQQELTGLSSLDQALSNLAAAGVEAQGAIYTKREVVEFILDLVGFSPEYPLYEYTLLEPSFGHGDFLLVAVERLIEAWRRHAPATTTAAQLAPCICAVELHEPSFYSTRDTLLALLKDHDVDSDEAEHLLNAWLIQDDFLLTPLTSVFDYVVGNPPYVRQEAIPDVLLGRYRAHYRTVFDRADLYIPFIERSLALLTESGVLGFICADRWMKNRYGGPLRKMIADSFHLRAYVDMVDTPAFHCEVTAYPAITVVARENQGPTRVASQPEISKPQLSALAEAMRAGDEIDPATRSCAAQVTELTNVTEGDQPWLLETSDELALVRRIEEEFPSIETAGCRVGIGVATGADNAFIGPYEELNVELDRKLPLAMRRDIDSGILQWRGFGVVNPFDNSGNLVDLREYPQLKAYLEARRNQIAKRHIARKAPTNWYRTIDKIHPSLADKPKLLIPDIKGEAQIVYEPGGLYPHHNLYYIVSSEWEIQPLQAVLLSGIARLFVRTYSTRMRGGYLRFQAQYLRRIRLPRWGDVQSQTRENLRRAADKEDIEACNRAVGYLYGLTPGESELLLRELT